jgi:hypothetical protein
MDEQNQQLGNTLWSITKGLMSQLFLFQEKA